MVTTTTAQFWASVKALAPQARYGPNYRRGVADELRSACFCWDKGDKDAALHFLSLAEKEASR
jgi:hypothetical protein